MYGMQRHCLVCLETFDSLPHVRDHVRERHPRKVFSRKLRESYIADAAMAYCGGEQPPCWMEGCAQYIPELGEVFGDSCPDAYYGGWVRRRRWMRLREPYFARHLDVLERATWRWDDMDDVLYEVAAEVLDT